MFRVYVPNKLKYSDIDSIKVFQYLNSNTMYLRLQTDYRYTYNKIVLNNGYSNKLLQKIKYYFL